MGGAAHVLTIGLNQFRSRRSALTYYSSILQSYAPGETLEGLDEVDLRALLALHPDYPALTDGGPHRIVVVRSDWGKNCFAIRWIVGGKPARPFSYRRAIFAVCLERR